MMVTIVGSGLGSTHCRQFSFETKQIRLILPRLTLYIQGGLSKFHGILTTYQPDTMPIGRTNIFGATLWAIRGCDSTICPRSSDPIYIVTYYIKWVTTSWTDHKLIKKKKKEKKSFCCLHWSCDLHYHQWHCRGGGGEAASFFFSFFSFFFIGLFVKNIQIDKFYL